MPSFLAPPFFAEKLLAWYQSTGRKLPWRETNDPYRIWLAEIILQQTRVAQGLPYYNRFISHFPTLTSLAKAEEQEILHLWQGLGYYTRARNLWRCAKEITCNHQGHFPSDYKELLKLPGIGPYTAAAIAAFAFEQSVAVVDGNVYRVLARLFELQKPIDTFAGKKTFQALATRLVPSNFPGLYNQAIMEFGALQCTPGFPDCTTCIFKTDCKAFAAGLQASLPIRAKRVAVRERYLHYIVLQQQGKSYWKKRTQKDIWQGLYDFYWIEGPLEPNWENYNDPLIQAIKAFQLPLLKVGATYSHQLTHQQLYITFWQVEVTSPFVKAAEKLLRTTGLTAHSSAKVAQLPKPILLARFWEKLGKGLLNPAPG